MLLPALLTLAARCSIGVAFDNPIINHTPDLLEDATFRIRN